MRNIEWIQESHFAHRGLHNNLKNIPENTMLAFQKAFERGYGIELDLRFTKDQSLIVFHDSTLKRLAKKDIIVDEQTYEELKDIKLLKSDESIPLFTDLLKAIPKNTPALIEFKRTKKYKEMINTFIEIMKTSDLIYAIHSFDPRVLRYFKKKDPSIIRGQIACSSKTNNAFSNYLLNLFISNPFTKPDFINYHLEDLPNKKLDKLKRKGITIISYTAKSQKALDFVKSRYDNAVFEGFIPIN